MNIYLDYASTYPPNKSILNTALDFYINEAYANSSGLSKNSQDANNHIRQCKSEIAALLSIQPDQFYFFSSASEIHSSLIWLLFRKHQKENTRKFKICSSPLEHPSIIETIRKLPNTDVTFLEFSDNQLNLAQAREVIPSQDLVITMAAHNETGLLLPADQIIEITEQNQVYSLIDCVQLASKLSPEHENPMINGKIFQNKEHTFFTIAGHKIGAGVGCALLITPDLSTAELDEFAELSVLQGGLQEFPFRPGTHNTYAIKAMELCFCEIFKQKDRYEKISTLRASFESGIKSKVPELEIIADNVTRLPGTSLAMIPGISIDFLIMALDRRKITVSTGTSCKSRSRTASEGLIALGLSEEQALQVIRVSYGYETTYEEIDIAIHELAESIKQLQMTHSS